MQADSSIFYFIHQELEQLNSALGLRWVCKLEELYDMLSVDGNNDPNCSSQRRKGALKV